MAELKIVKQGDRSDETGQTPGMTRLAGVASETAVSEGNCDHKTEKGHRKEDRVSQPGFDDKFLEAKRSFRLLVKERGFLYGQDPACCHCDE